MLLFFVESFESAPPVQHYFFYFTCPNVPPLLTTLTPRDVVFSSTEIIEGDNSSVPCALSLLRIRIWAYVSEACPSTGESETEKERTDQLMYC